MIVFLFRLLIFLAILFFFYSAYQYIVNPIRKLDQAHKKKTFYFYDEQDNVKKNFLVTYKGIMFEGEKYLGTTEKSFDVVTISVWTLSPDHLKGISKDDIYFLENEMLIYYPYATVEWRYPIKNLLQK